MFIICVPARLFLKSIIQNFKNLLIGSVTEVLQLIHRLQRYGLIWICFDAVEVLGLNAFSLALFCFGRSVYTTLCRKCPS